MFAFQKLLLSLLLSLPAYLTHAAPLTTEYISAEAPTRETYINNALIAANALNQKWFDSATGLWDNMWWQSANFLCTHADLTELAPERFMEVSSYFFETSVDQARKFNGGNFHNEYYDDEGWWAMALIRIYDVTKQKRYLTAARHTFEDMKTGRGAVCGGHWWSKEHTYIASIANELFLNVAAALANRVPARRAYYRDFAVASADWFLAAGLITANDTVADGLDTASCAPTGTVFTYNAGVILGALAELHALTASARYLAAAHRIAAGALAHLVDADGILTEVGWPDALDPTRAMFKGVFVRNLKYLHAASPREAYVGFLQKNADAVWARSREQGFLGPNWQGGYQDASPSSQGSGLDVLVAAAAVSA